MKFLALQKVLLLAKSGQAFAVPRNLRDHPLLQLHRPRAPSTPGSFAGTRASPSVAAAAGANSAGNLTSEQMEVKKSQRPRAVRVPDTLLSVGISVVCPLETRRSVRSQGSLEESKAPFACIQTSNRAFELRVLCWEWDLPAVLNLEVQTTWDGAGNPRWKMHPTHPSSSPQCLLRIPLNPLAGCN